MDPTKRGRYHIQVLSSSVQDKGEQRNRVGGGINMGGIVMGIIITRYPSPHPTPIFHAGGGGIQEVLH